MNQILKENCTPHNQYLYRTRKAIELNSLFFQNLGKTYAVGTILPQETGNCLQCVCTQGSNSEGPRVTCSPHNCPPLILPDLFDATGY